MKKVLLLLAKGFEEYEAAVFTDVLGWSRSEGDIPVHVDTAGLHEKIKCTWNFTVLPDLHVKDVDVDDYDAVAIPGGFEEAGFYDDAFHDDFLDIIRRFHSAGKIVASICVGALPLGKSGILKDKKATTYHLMDGYRRKQLAEFGVDVQYDAHVVVTGNIITSSCPETALDVAFTLLEMLTTRENCNKVKYHMGFETNTEIMKAKVSELVPRMYNEDVSVAHELFAPHCIHHINGITEEGRGPAVVEKSISEMNKMFPGSKTVLDDVFAVEDRVAFRWTWKGTNVITGKEWTFHGNTVFQIEDGKVVEYWAIDDRMREMQVQGFQLVPPEEFQQK